MSDESGSQNFSLAEVRFSRRAAVRVHHNNSPRDFYLVPFHCPGWPMGSRYGLLLASGARRYCRAAIRAQLLFSPFLSRLFRRYFAPSLARLSRSPSTGMVVYRATKKKRDWSDENPSARFDAILGLARGYIAYAKNAFNSCQHVGRHFFTAS